MTKIKGNCILITGGASGIGRIMGRKALEMGARQIVIWDINQASIESTEQEFSALGNVKGYRIDISDTNAVAETFAKTTEECGNIDILINCAGIITNNKTFDQCSAEDMDRTIQVNTLAPMYVARQVLPDMIARNSGHICNIASAGGMLPNPKMSIYSASKWAAVGWSDSVRIELKEMNSQVRVTTICPYFITTGMFDGVKSKVFPLLKPQEVAERIIGAIEGNKKMLMLMKWIPQPHHFIRLLQAVLPMNVFDWLMSDVLGIYHAMDNFTGRKK